MDYSGIKTYSDLKTVLRASLDGELHLEPEDLLELCGRFYALNEVLEQLGKKSSENDVLKTLSMDEGADFIVEESFSRVECVDLLLKHNNLPSPFKEQLCNQLPKFRELAILTKNIEQAKRRQLEILEKAGVTAKSNNSGCMVLIVILVVVGSITFLI